MSQYPSPYPPVPYGQPPVDFSYYTPQADLLAPARRASVLQAVLATLVLICGVCLGAFPWVTDVSAALSQSGMALPQVPAGMTLEELFRIAYTTAGVIAGLIGIALLALAYFVRGGGAGPAVASILLEALVVLGLALNLIGAVMQLAANPAAGLFTLLVILALLAVFGMNIVWLAGAARNASRINLARQQYGAQYHQFQQQQQAYGAYGMPYAPQPYGYAAPTGFGPAAAAPTAPGAPMSQAPPSQAPPASPPPQAPPAPQRPDGPDSTSGPGAPNA